MKDQLTKLFQLYFNSAEILASMSLETYTLREAKKHETGAIISFLETYHSPEDPITQAFFSANKHRITADEATLIQDDLWEFVNNSVCILALHDREIVGTLFIVPHTYLPPPGNRPQSQSILLQELKSYIHGIYEEEIRLAQRFPRARSDANLRNLAVHKEHRGRGLAKGLLNESVKWARKHGIDLLHSFFTSIEARRTAKGVGFERILEQDLRMARDAEGRAVFEDLGDNSFSAFMVKEIM